MTFGPQRERDRRAKASVAEDRDAVVAREMSLLEDLIRGRERLDEDRQLVGDRIGNRDQIRVGQREHFGEGAVAAEDSKDGTVRAMPRHRAAAPSATSAAASCVYLTGDPPPEHRPIGGFYNLADEFVAGDSAKRHVAARELEVGAEIPARRTRTRLSPSAACIRIVRAIF